MDLRQRKRINNLPKFNDGLSNSVSSIGGDVTGLQAYKTSLTSAPQKFEINSMSMPKFNGDTGGGTGGGTGGNAGSIMSQVGGSLGQAFSQNSKFDDKSSNTLGSMGTVAKAALPDKYGEAVGGAFNLASNYQGMINYSHGGSEMGTAAGTSERVINGIGYTTQNAIDTKGALDDVKETGTKNAVSSAGTGLAMGAALGSIIPGLGTIAGGIGGAVVGGVLGWLGGNKAKQRQQRINRNAIVQTDAINSMSEAYADTEGLQNKYYRNKRDTTGDILYANRGKDLRMRKRIKKTRI